MKIERRWTFVGTLIGLFILGFLSLFLMPVEIDSFEDLEKLPDQTMVFLHAQVISERASNGVVTLGTSQNITVLCECSGHFRTRSVDILGAVERFDEKTRIRAYRVRILS